MKKRVKNVLLEETAARVSALLGDRLDEIKIERAVLGLFFSGVKITDARGTSAGGLCYTPVKDMPEAVCCPSSAKAMPLSGKLASRSIRAYLEVLFDENILRRALAVAALNALSALCWELNPPKNPKLETGDTFETTELVPGEKTVVIGALVPMLKKLLAADADFHVLEFDPTPLKGRELAHYLHADRAGEVVPDADLLVITGVTLLNGTLPGLLEMAKPGARIVVTGPTASMLPDAFFARGVTMLGGILVTKPDEILDLISEGGSGYHFFGKSARRLILRNGAGA